MKKVKNSFKRFGEKTMLFIKKNTRIIQQIFKRGNVGFWILDGLIIILIIIVAIDVFSRVRRSGTIQYQQGAEVGISAGGQIKNREWKALTSFGGVGSGTNSIDVAPGIRWRIVLTTKTISRETNVLKLLVYRKEYPEEPIENFTKELEYRGSSGGRAKDAIEICDTTGGNFIIEVKSDNFDWNVQVETSKDQD